MLHLDLLEVLALQGVLEVQEVLALLEVLVHLELLVHQELLVVHLSNMILKSQHLQEPQVIQVLVDLK
jgi:hypothetical protein